MAADDQIQELLIRLASSLKEEDLIEDPELEQGLRGLLQSISPKTSLDPEIVSQLAEIEDRKKRFLYAMKMLQVAPEPEAMKSLAEAMQAAGLLASGQINTDQVEKPENQPPQGGQTEEDRPFKKSDIFHFINSQEHLFNKGLYKIEQKVTEDEVRAHIDRTCPHRENPSRNARLHANVSGQSWIKTKIPLKDIRESPHSKRDVKKYTKMIQAGSPPPPVVLTSLYKRPDGSHSIASVQDGAHRIAAAKAAGLTHIDAYVGDYTLEKSASKELEKGLKENAVAAMMAVSSMMPSAAHAAAKDLHTAVNSLHNRFGLQVESSFKPLSPKSPHGSGSYRIKRGRFSVVGNYHSGMGKNHEVNLVGPKQGAWTPQDHQDFSVMKQLHEQIGPYGDGGKSLDKSASDRLQELAEDQFANERKGYEHHVDEKEQKSDLKKGERGDWEKEGLNQGSKVRLVHYSRKEGLTRLDPKFHGTGIKGAERKRGSSPRTFYYFEGTKPERAVMEGGAGVRYVAELPENHKIYDVGKDPHGVVARAVEGTKGRQINPGILTPEETETAVQEAGYHGLYDSTHPNIPNAVTYFHPLDVKEEPSDPFASFFKFLDQGGTKMTKSFDDDQENLQKVGDGYKNLMASGIALLHPVKINNKEISEDGIPFHTTIKVFHPHDDRLEKVHGLAELLNFMPPDPSKTTVKPVIFKDRFGDDVHVLELGGDAERIVDHNSAFSQMGFPVKFKFRPHITVDEPTYNRAVNEKPNTAADLGVSFGEAELRHGYQTVRRYPPRS